MKPFTIVEPRSCAEASAMLAAYGEGAKVYAGGTELLLVMKEGLAHYDVLVNVKTIPGLRGIGPAASGGGDGSRLRIGALCTHRELETSPLLRQHAPALAEAERHIANVRVRNTGTIGGNLCFGEPHADPATVLLLCETVVVAESARGRRKVLLGDFFKGPLEVALEPDEILTELLLTIPPRAASAYLRFAMLERPSVGVGVALLPDKEGEGIIEARIALGCVRPTPVRVPEAEAVLAGSGLERARATASAVGEATAAAAGPIDDIYGSAEYKRHLVGVLTRRGIERALRQLSAAKGEA